MQAFINFINLKYCLHFMLINQISIPNLENKVSIAISHNFNVSAYFWQIALESRMSDLCKKKATLRYP